LDLPIKEGAFLTLGRRFLHPRFRGRGLGRPKIRRVLFLERGFQRGLKGRFGLGVFLGYT